MEREVVFLLDWSPDDPAKAFGRLKLINDNNDNHENMSSRKTFSFQRSLAISSVPIQQDATYPQLCHTHIEVEWREKGKVENLEN